MSYEKSTETKGKILITGGTGLLGRRLCELLLNSGYEIILLTRKKIKQPQKGITYLEADLSQKITLSKSDIGAIDTVFHLAQADGHGDFIGSASNIVSVTLNSLCQLAELSCSLGVKKFILASSGGIYGGGEQTFTEESPITFSDSLSFYLATKAAAEYLLKYFNKYFDISMLRYFFIYGPNQKSEMLIPRMLDAIMKDKEITLSTEQGPLLNPIYVDDAAKATMACMKTEKFPIINIAGDEIISLRKICEMIGSLIGKEPTFSIQNGSVKNFIGNNTLMRQTLHVPETLLMMGLQALVKGQ